MDQSSNLQFASFFDRVLRRDSKPNAVRLARKEMFLNLC